MDFQLLWFSDHTDVHLLEYLPKIAFSKAKNIKLKSKCELPFPLKVMPTHKLKTEKASLSTSQNQFQHFKLSFSYFKK